MKNKFFNVLALFICFTFSFALQSCGQNIRTQKNDSIKTDTIIVSGITCGMDLKIISGNLEKQKGISSCIAGKAKVATAFIVKYNSSEISKETIEKVIEESPDCTFPDQKPYKVKKRK